MNDKTKSGLSIVQADGNNDLDNPNDGNQGDAADPFPGAEDHFELSDVGIASTSFPGTRSGISFKNIKLGDDGVITLDVAFEGTPANTPKRPAKKSRAKKSVAKKSRPAKSAKAATVAKKAKKKKARPRK